MPEEESSKGGCTVHGSYDQCGHTTDNCPNTSDSERIRIEVSSEDDKENVQFELKGVEKVLDSIDSGDENIHYADTADSMDLIDMMLDRDPQYQLLKQERRAASQKIVRGNEDEKKEGLSEVREWVNKVREAIK